MSYNIELTDYFKRQFKRLLRKYPSLKKELLELSNKLEQNPEYGTPIGNNCYKIRLAVSSKGKGKSGGARVITHVYIIKRKVYLLSIYDKSEQENISQSTIDSILSSI
ncbi:type II toxin-antitoxin system RelE/ParE family toxin [Lacibacter sp. MH-610]|uniref:type II toxin-antitoxin system RelE/ParE family toxin n=1 Tax=Lacibacter sp. MH-610 TaxID=3020883 RepID=UPI00389130F5